MKNFLVIIDGPMGAGKTTVGNILHAKLSRMAVLSSDKIKFFISDFERGERDNAIAGAVLLRMCEEYIKHGINIVLPQGFWKKEYIEPYIQFAQTHSLALFVYQLDAPREVLLERIGNRPTPRLAKTPVPEERIKENLDSWELHRYHAGKTFDTTKYTPEEVAEEIIQDLKEWQ